MNHSVNRRRQALHQTRHHYYLNISVEAANLSDWQIESNRNNRFGSENRIESNRNFFCPNWNALLATTPPSRAAHTGRVSAVTAAKGRIAAAIAKIVRVSIAHTPHSI